MNRIYGIIGIKAKMIGTQTSQADQNQQAMEIYLEVIKP